jgi:glycosyltransferase involved in cell wall biosynthesis
MKILLICTNADLAGAPIHVRGLVAGLCNQVEYTCIFGESGPVAKTIASNNRVKVLFLPKLRSEINIFFDIITLIQMIKLIYQIQPDAVHLHSTKAAMIGRIACFIMNIPWVYSVHGWGWRGFGKVKSKIIFLIEKILSKCPNGRYIYVSKSVENDGIIKLGISPKLGMVVFNSAPNLDYNIEPKGALNILMAARVCSAKDHETLIKAFELVKCSSKLILCGNETDSHKFLQKIVNWAPNRYADIELMGIRDDVYTILNKVNIFALISNFEALPISIIEAMSSCRAVIATDVGGVSELVINNYNGLLIKQGDFIGLADCIEKLADTQYRHILAKNGRNAYEKYFSEEVMLQSIMDTYNKILKNDK